MEKIINFYLKYFGFQFSEHILKFFIHNVFLVFCSEFFSKFYFSIIIIILNFLIWNKGSFGNLKN